MEEERRQQYMDILWAVVSGRPQKSLGLLCSYLSTEIGTTHFVF